jgi:hypothetical protein
MGKGIGFGLLAPRKEGAPLSQVVARVILPCMLVLRFCAFVALAGVAAGCGSRTGLLVPDEPPQEAPEAGSDAGDATVPQDAGTDAFPDVFDAGVDATADATPDVTVDAPPDVLPPLEVGPARPIACQDSGATLIYLVTTQNDLWSFYPPSLSFTPIGHINCPVTDGTTPFSMAVDETGIAYVLYGDGAIFRVSTASARCTPTPFAVDQEQIKTFGMGYSEDPAGTTETLYIASDVDGDSGLPSRLGLIDTTSFALHTIGSFVPQIASAELTGTGAGDLFAFYSLNPAPNGPSGSGVPSAIGQIDKANGRVLGQTLLPNVAQGCAWAFAFWGGDFYAFVAPPAAGRTCETTPPVSTVWRYRPSDGSQMIITTLGEQIVGAGVSTCAPQE